MSSKTQFKDALKREKQTLSSLKKENDELKEKLQLREKIIDSQRYQMEILKGRLKKKYWWKFWK